MLWPRFSAKICFLFMSLSAAQIVSNSYILAGTYIIFLKWGPAANLKSCQYQISTPVKRSKK